MQWGVDYIKCDDICKTNLDPNRYSAGGEIRMLHQAIQAAGRPIVLSLSPGEENMTAEGRIEAQIAAHGAKLYRIL